MEADLHAIVSALVYSSKVLIVPNFDDIRFAPVSPLRMNITNPLSIKLSAASNTSILPTSYIAT